MKLLIKLWERVKTFWQKMCQKVKEVKEKEESWGR